jgi:hypothetical protein
MITLFGKRSLTLIERLFPPQLGRIDGVFVEDSESKEQGWAGNVQEKPYRDGIDRTFKEGLA